MIRAGFCSALFAIGILSPVVAWTEDLATAGSCPHHSSMNHAASHGPSPVSLMADHLHGEGGFMLGYRYMRQAMKDHRHGGGHTDHGDSPHEEHSPEGHHDEHHGHEHETIAHGWSARHAGHDHGTDGAEVPSVSSHAHRHSMSMDMHMIDVMYGLSDAVTLMAMVPFHRMEMRHHLSDMPHATHSNGLGDVGLSALWGVLREGSHELIVAPGVTLPTGDIDDKDTYHGVRRKHPYHMKLGSGTIDLTPVATYRFLQEGWHIGAQGGGVIRLGRNSENYALGNRARLTTWAGADLGAGVGATLRLSGEIWGDVRGSEEDQVVSSAFFDPKEQAGYLIDVGFGLVYQGQETLRGQRIGIEFGLPIDQDVDEGTHETDWSLTALWSVSF